MMITLHDAAKPGVNSSVQGRRVRLKSCGMKELMQSHVLTANVSAFI
jgi:hypothetical protein